MAIVKMRKLNLIGMSYEKDAVLDALHRTNAVDITLHAEFEDTAVSVVDVEEERAYYAEVESTLETLCLAVENYRKGRGDKTPVIQDGFDVSYSEFLEFRNKKETFDALLEKVRCLTDEKNGLKGELAKARKEKSEAQIYAEIEQPFASFLDTAHTCVRLGVIPLTSKDGLVKSIEEEPFCDVEILKTIENGALICVVCHKSVVTETENVLSAYGFSDCPYTGEKTGAGVYAELCKKEEEILRLIAQNEESVYALKGEIRGLKIYCDYLAFVLEKKGALEKMRETERTFLLQAYVPVTAEEDVKAQLHACSSAMYMEFSDPTETDEPPTLLKNNEIVSNFEGITNTYSAPNYREFDPNGIMALFYSIFMGFIIGDAGYGLAMLLGGGFLWWKGRKRPTGMSKLAGSFAIGGIFAVVWGLLFNSLFGFQPFKNVTLLPNPSESYWTLLGISVPSVLVISMLIGLVQIAVGYFCKAVQEWRRGGIVDGICDGLLWTFFTIGVGVALVGLTSVFKLPQTVAIVGGGIAGGSLLLAMLTAGRKEKFFGKFTKGFGAAYGVINFASDILSYARLYGLMLSGAVITTIIKDNCVKFVTSGNVLLIVLAVLLFVGGNAFNLVMNLLGAYIHDARLQYVEFYGRFFEGEGTLFRPLGSDQKHIFLSFSEVKPQTVQDKKAETL